MESNFLILIVDDIVRNVQVLGSMLKNNGYNVAAVTNGEKVLDFVDKRTPDLILLDIMMPGIDGFEVCQNLKSQEKTKEIPVIFITVLNNLEDKLRGFEVGGVDFITKPFQKKEVLARVRTHLELKKARERAENYVVKLKKRNQELEDLKKELNSQLEKGKQLHRQFLPDKLPHNRQISTAIYYQLAQRLGGDFYNFIELDDKLIGYIVDITGHGLDGALLNIFIREAINNFLQDKTGAINPSEILEFIYHKYNQESFSDDYFVCIGLFVLDKDRMKLSYSNSGLQVPPLLIKEHQVQKLDIRGLPISTAIEREAYEFNEVELTLQPTDKFLIMTDGLVEERRGGKMYGKDRLRGLVEVNKYLPVNGILNKVKEDFEHFIGDQLRYDDSTLLGVEYNPEILKQKVIELPSTYQVLEEVEQEVKSFISSCSIEFEKLLMALHEVLVNAIKHGNLEDETKQVKLTIQITKWYVKLVVEDRGLGFDWENTLQQEELYDNWEDSGRGLKIAELACDSIYYNEVGNKVYLIKLKLDD
ncbi:MAG: response regulator [Bacillota bacterium]